MTYIAHPVDASQELAFQAFCAALKIPYEKSGEESPYNLEFVAKIKQGEEDKKAGRGRKITIEELEELCK